MAAQTLSHDELWDDSALVNSWNDAFDEYKKYHSLASRGEKVEIQEQEPEVPQVKSKAAAYLANGTRPSTTTAQPSSAPINFSSTASAPVFAGPAAPPSLSTIPQAILGGAQNEDLKNIMMSWYYAGYYTGLYEGQQKAWAEIQQQQAAQEGGMEDQ